MAHFVAQETGEVITPEMIETLAAEAEEGYDLTQATEVRVRRPALGEDGTPSPRVSFRAPSDLYRALQKRANAEGRLRKVSGGVGKLCSSAYAHPLCFKP